MNRRLRMLILIAAVCAAGSAAIMFVRYRLEHDLRSNVYIPQHSAITADVELLQRYVRIDTQNPPGNETRGAQFLAQILKQNGIESELIESAPGRGNLYARIRGKQRGEGLLLLNHIDVVPAPAQGWTRPPFAAKIYIDNVWGRGTLDMKGIAICQLEAFIDVARSGKVPERDIAFLAVADEESGSSMGMALLVEHRPDLLEGIRYALNEGGVTETFKSEVSYVGIEIGTKMPVNLRLRTRDRATMERTRIALEKRMTPPDPDRVLPQVREYLHDIAPHRHEQGQYLDDVTHTIAAGKFWLLQPGYRELLQNVVAPRAIQEDDRGATMDVLMLNLPDEDPDARIEWLRKELARYGATIDDVTSKMGPAPLSPTNTPFFTLLKNEARRTMGNVTVGPQILAVSTNDSRFLRKRGIAAYGFWPFAVDFNQTQGIHGIDERVRVDWFKSGVKLTRDLLMTYAFGKLPGH